MQLTFRDAKMGDVQGLIRLLANDPLGRLREDLSEPLNNAYLEAFQAIERDPNNQLLVVEYAGQLVGVLQLTYIPYLTHTGSWRCLIEGVRIDESVRGKRIGEKMFIHAIELARLRGCKLVQLTSDKKRPDAIRFYQKLGFQDTHEGFKLSL